MNEFSRSFSPQQQVSAVIEKHGILRFGFAPLGRPLSIDLYNTWLDEKLHGTMNYLNDHREQKENPELLLKKAHSAIVVAVNYLPHPLPNKILPNSPIALYARGEDYHFWLKEKLEAIKRDLKQIFVNEEFLTATDSKPILERDLAYKAGLGWIGKNTCLIDQKHGSLFIIGEILTTLKLTTVQLEHPDRCGTCNRCIDACPTEAIVAPRKIDARKCISYLTIEAKNDPALPLREKMGAHLFGCDICQTVCPWNEKAFGETLTKTQNEIPQVTDELLEELRFILNSSNKSLEKHLKGSPLSRARGNGLKRNTLIVIANLKLKILLPEVEACLKVEKLHSLAGWALEQLAH